jgi:hypothetical protein
MWTRGAQVSGPEGRKEGQTVPSRSSSSSAFPLVSDNSVSTPALCDLDSAHTHLLAASPRSQLTKSKTYMILVKNHTPRWI